MGVKCLNKYLQKKCSDLLIKKSLSELQNKKIAIDISIYLYKFSENGNCLENFKNMFILLKQYQIIPIFVFDGKPPEEKNKVLDKRYEQKLLAKEKYEKLEKKLLALESLEFDTTDSESTLSSDSDENTNNICNNYSHKLTTEIKLKMETEMEMQKLKKEFIIIKQSLKRDIKELITSFGFTHIDATGEADELCSLLVHKELAWACVSEDMDMFVYGCPRVIRNINLNNGTCVIYNTTEILKKLNITQQDLREICILSGTDYSPNIISTNFYQIMDYYWSWRKKWQRMIDFTIWITNNTKLISNLNEFKKIYNMFDLELISKNYHLEINI